MRKCMQVAALSMQSDHGTAGSSDERTQPAATSSAQVQASAGSTRFKLTSKKAHNPHSVLALLQTHAALCETPKRASAAQLQLLPHQQVDGKVK
jgi:hypothetical protein